MFKLNKINKLNHNVLFIFLSPFFVYFGIKQIIFPVNILFILIGILLILLGNKRYEETKKIRYLFEIILLGPLLVILGFSKNKYEHLKNLMCVIGFVIFLYSTRSIFINTFLLRG